MISEQEAIKIRAGIRKALARHSMTAGSIATAIKQDRVVVSAQLRRMKNCGEVFSDGQRDLPRWALTNKPAASDDGFVSNPDPNLRKLVAQQWRGTWMQGLEVVL